MRNYKIQICLVSAQNTPNITTALEPSGNVELVILCTTESMKETAFYLEKFIYSKGLKVELFDIGNGYNFNELKDRFLELASRLQGSITAVNLTCGNKLMTIAAQEVFKDDFSLFYVSPESVVIPINNSTDKKFKLTTKLKVQDIFHIYGYSILSKEKKKNISSESRTLFLELFKCIEKFSSPLGVLNTLAEDAEINNKLSIKNKVPRKSWELLSLFQKHGSISYYDDMNIEFRNVDSRRFCNGFWFEEAIYLKLIQLKDSIGYDDMASSIEIVKNNGAVNEIDIAYTFNNSLHIIECKTANMNFKGNDALYKMDTIKGYASSYSKGVIISYRKLPSHILRRAEDLKITVIHGSEINNMEKILLKLQR